MKDAHTDIRRTLLLLKRDDSMLLALKKRGFGEGKWNGVGGKIDAGETLEEALLRETEEEIGVTPTTWRAVAELDFIQDAETPEPWHMYVYAYTCEEWEGEPIESEEMKPQWFKVRDLPFSEMWDDDRYWLPPVLDGKKVIGTFTFDSHDKLLTQTVIEVEDLPHEKT